MEVGPASAAALQAGQHASVFRHKQTLANAVRFTTDELSALESRILNATSDALSREFALFDELANAVLEAESAIARAASALASLDCLSALGELAQAQNYVRPRVDASRCFLIECGRHPAVEQALAREGAPFIANDCKLDGSGERAPGFFVVTGPNMAAKPPISGRTRLSPCLRKWAPMCRLRPPISAWRTGFSPASAPPTISRAAAQPSWWR